MSIDVKYYKSLSRKRVGSGVLFFNTEGELLIVKPTYKDYWTIPGGTVDTNESPHETAIREVKEEIGLVVSDVKFCAVDYIPDKDEKGEAFQFIFYGGILKEDDIACMRLPTEELSEFCFVKPEEAMKFLGERAQKRLPTILQNALKDGKPVYLESGALV